MTYKDKLKDPRWQKKRLEVLEGNEWQCQACGDTKTSLHVHHDHYTGEPWEALTEDLFVLCERCHNKIHKAKIKASSYLYSLNTEDFDLCYLALEKILAAELEIDETAILRLAVLFHNKFEEMQIEQFFKGRK